MMPSQALPHTYCQYMRRAGRREQQNGISGTARGPFRAPRATFHRQAADGRPGLLFLPIRAGGRARFHDKNKKSPPKAGLSDCEKVVRFSKRHDSYKGYRILHMKAPSYRTGLFDNQGYAFEKNILSDAFEEIAGFQKRGRKLRMVRAVGKMLGFQAEALMAVEAGAALSHVCLQPVGRIELHTRLVGQTVHPDAGFRSKGGQHPAEARPVQDVIVIVSAAQTQLRQRVFDILSDRLTFPEIEGVPSTARNSPVGISLPSTGGDRIGINSEDVVENIPAIITI